MALSNDVVALFYLAAGILVILGLNRLSRPATARQGNYYAITGMVVAISVTLMQQDVTRYGFVIAGIVVGGIIGTLIALKIKMTAVPQLVALLHSFVGLAATLIAVGIFMEKSAAHQLSTVLAVELFIGAVIGAITFSGSLVAFAKLQALMPSKPLRFTGQHWVNLFLGLSLFGLGGYFLLTYSLGALVVIVGIAVLFGVLLIVPIGGPDMPVIVSMLNSYSGWAAAATGFTLGNHLLIMVGALVGFSGAILSYIMCRAMNRTLLNVVLGGFGGNNSSQDVNTTSNDRGFKSAAVEDATFMMENAERVIIVPGYGMAVAQAQQAVKELMEHLEAKGVDVKFAIHPVAGRMPGHMNVLLAEADIPYEKVYEMDVINSEFSQADIALVVGANDVTNPAAKDDESSPIYGMPILDVYKARQTFFIKRSMRPGYSGVDNQLFYRDNCSLIFGDAKDICQKMVSQYAMAA
ncbi:MAG: NAD(P)(+) transhydrogenase (Re/Si-specific) subunit beta [Gammaproteobacteria bacterium]|nr:MAG: NAD(P)(+) transhydrogenase (Re/Si-specific) subunit beta [Gammaproteobacteria bacterium]